jgi:hypothetical protein
MNGVLTLLAWSASLGHLGTFDAEPRSAPGVDPND